MVVMAKETQSITKDEVTSDVTVLFVDDIIAKNYHEEKVLDTNVTYTAGMDLSAYGNNVKSFIEGRLN